MDGSMRIRSFLVGLRRAAKRGWGPPLALALLLLSVAVAGRTIDGPGRPAPEGPSPLFVPEPNVGDRGRYAVIDAHGEATGPVFDFTWSGEEAIWDGRGELRLTHLLQYVVRPEMPTTPPDERVTHSRRANFDASSGDVVAWGSSAPLLAKGLDGPRKEQDERTSLASRLRILDPGLQRPPDLLCGVQNAFQGVAWTGGTAAGFQACTLNLSAGIARPLGYPSDLLRGPKANSFISTPSSLAFAGAGHLGPYDTWIFETRSLDETAVQYRAWLTDAIPYPLRMEWTVDDEPRIIQLVSFQRGSTAFADEWVYEKAAPLRWTDWNPWGVDDQIEPGAFVLSDAYRFARDDPTNTALRDYLRDHADSRLVNASLDESPIDGAVAWRWSLSDASAGLHLTVTRIGPGPVGSPLVATTNISPAWSEAAPSPPAAPIAPAPARFPTADVLRERFRVYLPDAGAAKLLGYETLQVWDEDPMIVAILGGTAAPSTQPGRLGDRLLIDERGIAIGDQVIAAQSIDLFDGLAAHQLLPSSEPPAEPAPSVARWWSAIDWRPFDAAALATLGLLGLLALALVGALQRFEAFLLFSRQGGTALLAHPARQRIAEMADRQPGIRLPHVAFALRMNRATVWYHLRVLRYHGRIRLAKVAGVWRAFPATGRLDEHTNRLLLATDPPLRHLVEFVQSADGVQAKVARESLQARWGLTTSGAWKVVRRGRRAGFIDSERRGRRVVLRPTIQRPSTAPFSK